MENLIRVIQERNRAEAELELGEWVGPKLVDDVDVLGRPVRRLTSEHAEPQRADRSARADERMWGQKTVELLRLERERAAVRRREKRRRQLYASRAERWKKLDYLSDSSK
ncbi:39S ribosomal protein L47 mitochondrial [Fasciolopsis buskii]|uniref:39S ribosomal protein L47 mitochondrial n=1 Tax=Fasciolopsis buskii TaxID=27845 RepID=A0A8E0VPE9_9TREM|nr:39S ribosomal protein L47 mitochondrial [Fasciolopsis buski]